MSYSCKIENEADFAKARVEGVNASYKDLAEVCGNIRRKPAEAAVALLEDASAGKIPLRYRSHNTRMAHRKELMGQKGRWPMKAAGIVLKCLQSAIANAKEKGLSEELVVVHACANKKDTYMRYSSKGRRNISKMQTSRVEVVLREKEEGKKKRMEEAKKKKADEAKKPKKEEGAKAPAASGKGGEAKAKTPESPKAEKEVKPASEKPMKKAEAPKKEESPAKKEGGSAPKAESPAEKAGGKAPSKDDSKPKSEPAKPEPKDAGEKKEVA